MIGIRARSRFDARKIRRAVNRANFESLGQAAGAIRLTARRSIRRRKRPSPVAHPPSTQTGRLKKSILFSQDRARTSAIIGPSADIVGPVGSAHEFGGNFRSERYPKRPFMGPALKKNLSRLPRFWKASVR